MNRINGELTAFNTVKIINHFKPKYYVIENPAHGRIWEYIKKVLGFDIPYENLTYYSSYDYPISKPTKFGSNVDLKLNKNRPPNSMKFNELKGYNNRSNIPEILVKSIFNTLLEKWSKGES